MINKTIEERLLERAEKAKTRIKLIEVCDYFVEEIISSDERVYSIEKRFSGYGTWKIKLWLNEYHFGYELKNRIEKRYILTHDEYKEPTIEDFREIIDNVVNEVAYENW